MQADALTSARRLLTFALDQQATAQAQVNSAQVQVDMAVEPESATNRVSNYESATKTNRVSNYEQPSQQPRVSN